MIRFIGDTHAKFPLYRAIATAPVETDDPTNKIFVPSIQVGDFGMGFKTAPILAPEHRFIRGNHDNPQLCAEHPNWIADGAVEDLPSGGKMMLIGGALSADKEMRVEGVTWWQGEELPQAALNRLTEVYADVKPTVMVTHDCPEVVAWDLFPGHMKFYYPSRTRQAFQMMLAIHKPDRWIFGHWHKGRNTVIGSTQFICLDELEYMDIPL
jgi:Calcineurin-like phosphoesterase